MRRWTEETRRTVLIFENTFRNSVSFPFLHLKTLKTKSTSGLRDAFF
ncbi:conserved hypothetical protein [delta proteobacterium NaphS2]|nr:conserved hypothetical protein [delta proteobacterium NaphS2]